MTVHRVYRRKSISARTKDVCQIIGYHHTLGVVDTINFKVVYGADLIVNLEDEELPRGRFLTKGSKRVIGPQQC